MSVDHSRDPCPIVILNDFGGAFSMGVIGGVIWHGIKGFRNSPYGEKTYGALTTIKIRAPVIGGNFCVWGGLFSTFDCTVKSIRKKEDAWNAIIAGFFTGGSLAIRGGWRHTRNSAITCACLLGIFEGVGLMMLKFMSPPPAASVHPQENLSVHPQENLSVHPQENLSVHPA